jgi:hypothetical protein
MAAGTAEAGHWAFRVVWTPSGPGKLVVREAQQSDQGREACLVIREPGR